MTQANANKRGGLLRLLGMLVLGLVFTVVVVGLLLWLAGTFNEKIRPGSGHAAASREHIVHGDAQTTVAMLVSIPIVERTVGSVEPTLRASVASRILSRVIEVNAQAGRRVEPGEVLVRLDDTNLRQRLEQARAAVAAQSARVDQAREQLTRTQAARAQHVASELEVIQARNTLKEAEAELDQADRAVEEGQAVLAYATVTAPFGGTVVEEHVKVGDTVSPGQTLLVMYDQDKMQLVASVRESLSTRLEVGQQVAAGIDSLGIDCLATVAEIVPEASAQSRSFRIKVTGPCPPGVYPGMFGRISIPLGQREVLVIPPVAVRRVGQLDLVSVVHESDGRRVARTRAVQLGRTSDEGVEVLSGIAAGETLLLGRAAPEGGS